MERSIVVTEDGSHSLFVPLLNEHYHSIHGAIQESMHVFIQAGFNEIDKEQITIFEVGFGTGLNALLTYMNIPEGKHVTYISIEKYPVQKDEVLNLNYAQMLNSSAQKVFEQLHTCEWGRVVPISDYFALLKIQADISEYHFNDIPRFDLIYYDAFAPEKQPYLWDFQLFQRLFEHCNQQAIFVTYCAKGQVRRDLTQAGFSMERLPGPPGKLQMLRGRVSAH